MDTTENHGILAQMNRGLADVAARGRSGIVRVMNAPAGHGTGILLKGGFIVTNAHVVRRRYPFVQLADGTRTRAQVQAWDEALDLAVLSIENAIPLSLELSPDGRPQPGDLVIAIGHPWGVPGAATLGTIHATSGWAPPSLPGGEWIACDAHLRPGHSGGPLLDRYGAVVGINTMVVGPDLGVAVPAHVVRRFLDAHWPRRAGMEQPA